MENGIYAQANKIIKDMKSTGHYILDRKEISERLDIDEMSHGALVEFVKNFASSVGLYMNGYRSVVKGKGVYIDVDVVNNKETMEALISNSESDISSRTAIMQLLQSKNLKLSDIYDDSQIAFTKGEDNETIFYDEITKSELISLLQNLQEQASK